MEKLEIEIASPSRKRKATEENEEAVSTKNRTLT
jgi:hypothetical protein